VLYFGFVFCPLICSVTFSRVHVSRKCLYFLSKMFFHCVYLSFLGMVQAPVGRIFFTGEHTSERFSGYVHGAYLAGKSLIYLKFALLKR